MNIIKTILITTITLLFISCDGENTQTPIHDIESIEIDQSSATLYSTLSTSLTATVTYTDGLKEDVTSRVDWISSDRTIVTGVNSGAIIEGELVGGIKNGGDAQVHIEYKDIISSSIPVHVIKLLDYNIFLLDADANVSGTYNLDATGYFENNSTEKIIHNIAWYADNEAIITQEDDQIQIELFVGDTNITSILFNDANTTKEIIYTAN